MYCKHHLLVNLHAGYYRYEGSQCTCRERDLDARFLVPSISFYLSWFFTKPSLFLTKKIYVFLCSIRITSPIHHLVSTLHYWYAKPVTWSLPTKSNMSSSKFIYTNRDASIILVSSLVWGSLPSRQLRE